MRIRFDHMAFVITLGLVAWHIMTGSLVPLLVLCALSFGFLTWAIWLGLSRAKLPYHGRLLRRSEDPRTFRFAFILYAFGWLVMLLLLLGSKYALASRFEPGLRSEDIKYLAASGFGVLLAWLYARMKRSN